MSPDSRNYVAVTNHRNTPENIYLQILVLHKHMKHNRNSIILMKKNIAVKLSSQEIH